MGSMILAAGAVARWTSKGARVARLVFTVFQGHQIKLMNSSHLFNTHQAHGAK